MNKIVQVLGPTGIGKSHIAVQLCRQLNGEVISADSVQVYKGFDIGSSKITESEMSGIPHHLIDILSPADRFNVNRFIRYSVEIITDISGRGKLPVVCGGTALYLRAMIKGIFEESSYRRISRERLKAICDEKGLPYLWERLEKIDSDYALKIGPNDKKRIIRGLEIYYNNRIPPTRIASVTMPPFQDHDFIRIGLILPRERMYERINSRVDGMIKKGLIEEVRRLRKMHGPDCGPMQSIGYREISEMLAGRTDTDTAIEVIKQHSRNFAKRQMSWFNGEKDIEWFDPGEEYRIVKYVKKKLNEHS